MESTVVKDTTTPSLIQEQQEKAAAVSQSHQFAINEEVLVALSFYTKGMSALGLSKFVRKQIRKGLSLSEYQEQKLAGTL